MLAFHSVYASFAEKRVPLSKDKIVYTTRGSFGSYIPTTAHKEEVKSFAMTRNSARSYSFESAKGDIECE